MRTRSLGEGLLVSSLGLGGMPMSLAGRPSEEQSIAVIHAALDGGITLIDTADVYCVDDHDIGHNERLIAKALKAWRGDRSKVLVATKGGLRRPHGDWVTDARPERLRAACEASLRALGVDRIALYQLHAPDPAVAFEDSVGELARLRAEGKIAHVGLSNVSAAEIDTARALVPIASVQNRCNVIDRRAFEQGVIARCEALGIGFLAYSPVGGSRGRAGLAANAALGEIAARHGATPEEIAIAWLLARSPAIVPIPGASKPASIASILRAAEVQLSAAELAQLG
ncbi:aldo/keto reductase [Sandaracinus amylolyticus]|uniref:aldo/keto reductase n=1 Tax=Sandaracinus amylolyticus TaxID=927083 RepID=UPI001F27BB74|nr:aldo/keto reductase [Sandaracinus amylolyticus]UJR78672.1 putative oxidoreductase [Sandaracinus amylolyticus]